MSILRPASVMEAPGHRGPCRRKVADLVFLGLSIPFRHPAEDTVQLESAASIPLGTHMSFVFSVSLQRTLAL